MPPRSETWPEEGFPTVWIVTGVPGAGKSTTARALATSVPRGVHIEGDALQRLIVSGNVPPLPEGGEESDRQIELNVRNQCLLARSFAAEGFVVAIDYVVSTRWRLETYLYLLAGETVGFVMLNPDLAVAQWRDQNRGLKRVLHQWGHLAGEMCAEHAGVGLWIDNGGLGPEEVAAAIHDKWRAAVVLPAP